MTLLEQAEDRLRVRFVAEAAYQRSIRAGAQEGSDVWAKANAWVENEDAILAGWLATDATLVAAALATVAQEERTCASEARPKEVTP